ncbi:membrane-spanning 4-domains subfamily A member 4D-like [Acipenser oxyrinchus oxyrinchus]|uniref:Membrane-spanning 4-domains subfamily A member 4D-like n=1 Tax=Acipenser oxyrinchus oxyrinchus TaxID=40147 RepID=A0AAD8CIU9_ACIOX|nr:membrane-spanning 4-domains subfamily A member 4D-like [Acipenser oxyrinchus oxyrinchus]KAK1154720.1 membrane-spanning 4-domains subfamily A member 4D-like [Acipenser oxyrinchus oxyrinchus]
MTSSISADSGMVAITSFTRKAVITPTPAPAKCSEGPGGAGTALSPEPYQIKAFLKGQPKGLQICIGVLNMVFGGVLTLSGNISTAITRAPYWTGALYIISGSLSIPAPNVRLIKAALGMNVVSSIAAVLGICNYSIDILSSAIPQYCYGYYNQFCWGYVNKEIVLNTVPLILTLVEFCLAISVAAFGCKAVCHDSSMPVVVVYNSFSPAKVRGQNPHSETKYAPPSYTE